MNTNHFDDDDWSNASSETRLTMLLACMAIQDINMNQLYEDDHPSNRLVTTTRVSSNPRRASTSSNPLYSRNRFRWRKTGNRNTRVESAVRYNNTSRSSQALKMKPPTVVSTHTKLVDTKTEETRYPSTKSCVVCLEEDVNHVIIPCGHICLCQKCAKSNVLRKMNKRCPECRGKMEKVYRVYGRIVEN